VQLGISDHSTVYTLINTATGNLSGGLGYAATYAWVYSLLVMAVIGLAFLILRQPKGGGRTYEE
jgi:predicted Co/Zn/Cd cation transporter (cation efflux family)